MQPDYIGFVFYPKSSRKVDKKQAKEWKSKLLPSIQAVGVFVDTPVNMIIEYLKEGIIDIVQLHGNESEQEIQRIQKETKKQVIKAIKVRREENIKVWLDSAADYLLFDNGMGTGETFDWKILKEVKRKFFLAGGLKIENIETAAKLLHPYCMDISSGAETEGRKDLEKMQKLTEMVHSFHITDMIETIYI